MRNARNRTSILIGIFVLAVFVARWPLDNYICNADTWHSTTQVNKRTGNPVAWRPPSNEGKNFLDNLFLGGSGTPAVFAMLGGQRYMVANIMWQYADTLFHQGKPAECIAPMKATVELNPTFTDGWSVYGWHMAWNMFTYTNDPSRKLKYLQDGESIYRRATEMNPEKVTHWFDLGWLYLKRRGDYEKARVIFEKIVKSGEFEPMPLDKSLPEYQKELYWTPEKEGHCLAYVYKQLGIMTGDVKYFDKSIATYQLCLDLRPKNAAAIYNLTVMKKHKTDPKWLKEQRATMDSLRKSFGLSPAEYKRPSDEQIDN